MEKVEERMNNRYMTTKKKKFVKRRIVNQFTFGNGFPSFRTTTNKSNVQSRLKQMRFHNTMPPPPQFPLPSLPQSLPQSQKGGITFKRVNNIAPLRNSFGTVQQISFQPLSISQSKVANKKRRGVGGFPIIRNANKDNELKEVQDRIAKLKTYQRNAEKKFGSSLFQMNKLANIMNSGKLQTNVPVKEVFIRPQQPNSNPFKILKIIPEQVQEKENSEKLHHEVNDNSNLHMFGFESKKISPIRPRGTNFIPRPIPVKIPTQFQNHPPPPLHHHNIYNTHQHHIQNLQKLKPVPIPRPITLPYTHHNIMPLIPQQHQNVLEHPYLKKQKEILIRAQNVEFANQNRRARAKTINKLKRKRAKMLANSATGSDESETERPKKKRKKNIIDVEIDDKYISYGMPVTATLKDLPKFPINVQRLVLNLTKHGKSVEDVLSSHSSPSAKDEKTSNTDNKDTKKEKDNKSNVEDKKEKVKKKEKEKVNVKEKEKEDKDKEKEDKDTKDEIIVKSESKIDDNSTFDIGGSNISFGIPLSQQSVDGNLFNYVGYNNINLPSKSNIISIKSNESNIIWDEIDLDPEYENEGNGNEGAKKGNTSKKKGKKKKKKKKKKKSKKKKKEKAKKKKRKDKFYW